MAATKKAKAKQAGKKGANKTRKDGKRKIWEKKNPRSSSKKMTKGQKQAAEVKATSEGRSKPSLVDNINAQKGKGAKTSKKAGGKKAANAKKGGGKKG